LVTTEDGIDAWLARKAARRLGAIHAPGDLRAAARRALPRMVFDYVDGGAGGEATLRANRAALDAIGLLPSGLRDVSVVDTSRELFGQKLALPVIVGPTGLASASWPRGEIALARAAHHAGIPFVLANAGSVAPEDVAAAAPGHAWFQLYPPPDMAAGREWVGRIKAAGFSALEVTIDVPVPGMRLRDTRNGFAIPFKWTPAKLWDVAQRPQWALAMLRHGAPQPYLTLDAPKNGAAGRTQSEARRHRFSPNLSWRLLEEIRRMWTGPLVLKGVMDPRIIEQAAVIGYDGVVISNHGGRQLDGAPASITMLPECVDAARGRLKLLVDGGFVSGIDVLRAIALGADAVQLGRAPVYALATAGEAGVAHYLRLLAADIANAMALCGASRLAEIDAALVRRI
jgi:(S)-mandelate dehydrogenase